MTVKISKKILYKFCLTMWIVCSIFFGRTTINEIIENTAISIYSVARIATYALLVCIILLGSITKRETVGIMVISVFLILSAVFSGEVVLVGVLLFVVAAKNIQSDDILAVYFRTHLLILLTTITLAMTHIMDTNIMRRGLIQRNSFGFSHPNGLGGEVLIVCICFVTIRWEKLKNYELFSVICLGFFFLQAADCRMASIVLALYMFSFFIIKNIFKYNVRVIFIRNVVILIFLVIVLITFFGIFFYSRENYVLRAIDKIISHRFDAMHTVYKMWGINLFGQKTLQNAINIDNSYARILLFNGIIPFSILVVFSVGVCIELAKRNQVKYLLAFAAIMLSGFIENTFFRIENNFCLVIGGTYLLSSYYEHRRKKNND